MFNNKAFTVQELKEQFMNECTILDPKKEYPGYIGKEKYFIVTSLSESELKSKYKHIVELFTPYLVLNKSFINARADFKRNEDKHKKRAKRTEDIYGYVDGETEIFHKELVVEELFEEFITSIQIDSVYKVAEMLPKKDLDDNLLVHETNKMTLNSFWDSYIDLKKELKKSTRSNYIYMYNSHVRPSFGRRNIADIRYSDVKRFYVSLIHDKGFKPNSMEIIHTILHPVFTSAVRDGYIRNNPSDGVMGDIKKSHAWEKPKRHALTVKQQEMFVKFTAESYQYKHWLPLITVMLGTGCRIGEVLGLRWEDCNFEDNVININHTLIYRKFTDEPCQFSITTPKTKSGERIIPMLSDVREALKQEYMCQLEDGFNESEIDGYTGFIFKSRYNTVLAPHSVNTAIARIIKACNAKEIEDAKSEGRTPDLLPHFSCHNLRHTFCTRFCENETNLKVIQEIMGHADITTTMDVYNEATKDKKIEAFAGLEGKIKIR